jgi:hypothetical protein
MSRMQRQQQQQQKQQHVRKYLTQSTLLIWVVMYCLLSCTTSTGKGVGVGAKFTINITNDNVNDYNTTVKNDIGVKTTVFVSGSGANVTSKTNGNSNNGGASSTDKYANTTTLCEMDLEMKNLNETTVSDKPVILQVNGTFASGEDNNDVLKLRPDVIASIQINYLNALKPVEDQYVFNGIDCENVNVLPDSNQWIFDGCTWTTNGQDFTINTTFIPKEEGEIQNAAVAVLFYDTICSKFDYIKSEPLAIAVEPASNQDGDDDQELKFKSSRQRIIHPRRHVHRRDEL